MATKPKIESKVEAAAAPVVKHASSLEAFTVNHPLATKVFGITAITAATFGAISAWQARKLYKAEEAEVLDGRVVLIDDSSETA